MNAINQSGWKPDMGNAAASKPSTYTGNRALMLEEALIFEIGNEGQAEEKRDKKGSLMKMKQLASQLGYKGDFFTNPASEFASAEDFEKLVNSGTKSRKTVKRRAGTEESTTGKRQKALK